METGNIVLKCVDSDGEKAYYSYAVAIVAALGESAIVTQNSRTI